MREIVVIVCVIVAGCSLANCQTLFIHLDKRAEQERYRAEAEAHLRFVEKIGGYDLHAFYPSSETIRN